MKKIIAVNFYLSALPAILKKDAERWGFIVKSIGFTAES